MRHRQAIIRAFHSKYFSSQNVYFLPIYIAHIETFFDSVAVGMHIRVVLMHIYHI